MRLIKPHSLDKSRRNVSMSARAVGQHFAGVLVACVHAKACVRRLARHHEGRLRDNNREWLQGDAWLHRVVGGLTRERIWVRLFNPTLTDPALLSQF